MTDDNDLSKALSAKEAAGVIGIDAQTLCIWRRKNQGPPYIRRVGRILYLREDIAAWQRGLRVDTGQ